MRLIDADALCGEFKRRAVSARNWKERAIMEKNEEAIIRADATLAFLSEVKLTIDNTPTVDAYTEDDVKTAIKEGHEVGYEMAKAKFERPQGEWIFKHNSSDVWCSVCDISLESNLCEGIRFRYCPNCGADMRGGRE